MRRFTPKPIATWYSPKAFQQWKSVERRKTVTVWQDIRTFGIFALIMYAFMAFASRLDDDLPLLWTMLATTGLLIIIAALSLLPAQKVRMRLYPDSLRIGSRKQPLLLRNVKNFEYRQVLFEREQLHYLQVMDVDDREHLFGLEPGVQREAVLRLFAEAVAENQESDGRG